VNSANNQTMDSVVNEPIAGMGSSPLKEVPEVGGPSNSLPEVVLPGGSMSLSEAAANLFREMAKTHNFYVRAGRVMTVLPRGGETGLVLSPLSPEEAQSEFEKIARLVRPFTPEKGMTILLPAICRPAEAKALLATREAKEILPTLNTLTNCPFLYEEDGKLRTARPGYDSIRKVFVTSNVEVPDVPLEEAKRGLEELLGDFNFVSPADKSRAMASLISPALKVGGLIGQRVPADVAEADSSQSGKTYRQKIIAAVYNEKVAVVVGRNGGVGSVDETFSEMLVAGRPFIQFDNLRGKLDSRFLEAFMTADGLFSCRIPNRGSFDVEPENFFILATSNGVETTRDFANRSNIIRIRKQPDKYPFRTFKEGSLLEHVRANQPFCLGCVFSAVREWHKAGKPRTDETRHDFREWAQVVDWIVQKIFGLPPVMEGHRSAQERVSNPDMVFLRSVALAIEKVEQLGIAQTATEIGQLCMGEAIKIPGLHEDASEDRCGRQVGICMGRLFKPDSCVTFDQYQVRREISTKPRGDGSGNTQLKVYVFERVDDFSNRVSDRDSRSKMESAVERAKPTPFSSVPSL